MPAPDADMVDLTGYRLTFDDEFNNRSISQSGAGTTWADIRPEWRLDTNSDIGFGHSSFVDASSGYDPFIVRDGVLSITAVPDRTQSGFPGSWESGLITTQQNFSQTYGYFEIRADFSDQAGAWDAFWLLPNQQTPDPNSAGGHQELDVIEHYGSFGQGVYSTIHTTDPQNGIPWQDNRQVYSELASPAGFHTYGMDWEPEQITFYVDGHPVGSQPTPSDMHNPMYMLVNLATQGSDGNNADAAGVPITSKIDYVRAYSRPENLGSTVNYGFKFTEAHFDFSSGHDVMTAPDGTRTDLTGAGTLVFTDGSIKPSAGPSLVDNIYYYANNLDVWAAHIDAKNDYNQSGWKKGRDPNAFFSTNGYLAANPDVKVAGINPLTHYDQTGWKEGRDPSANFDNELYLRNNPDVKAANIDPLAHYLGGGQAEGRQASTTIGQSGSFTVHGSFDAEYYLLNNPDVAKAAQAAGGDPYAFAYQHYDAQGWKEGRNPSAYFDTNYYLANNPDVKAAHIDPLAHYDQGGWTEGRDPSAVFHTNAYLAANPDVASAHVDPLLHYLQSGADAGQHLA